MVDQIESIQLALFLNAPSAADALAFWSLTSAVSPTAFQNAGSGQSNAQGLVAGQSAQVIVQPLRVDLIISGVPSIDSPIAFLPDLDAALGTARVAIEKWIPHLTVGRAAAVIRGSALADNPADAVAKLQALFPQLPSHPAATDIQYQITVPMVSAINPLRTIQQLCRWQLVQAQRMHLVGQQMVPQLLHGAHMYVDIYGESAEVLDSAAAVAAMHEVVDRAKVLFKGGFGELG